MTCSPDGLAKGPGIRNDGNQKRFLRDPERRARDGLSNGSNSEHGHRNSARPTFSKSESLQDLEELRGRHI